VVARFGERPTRHKENNRDQNIEKIKHIEILR